MNEKGHIITALLPVVWAIAASTALLISHTAAAQTAVEPSVKHSDVPVVSSKGDSVPLASPPPEKNYLFEGTNETWLKRGLQGLEQFQVWLGARIQNGGELIDDYFGSEESFERVRGSRVDVLTPVVFHDSGQVEMTLKVRAKMALPKIEDRWKLIITTEDTSIKGQANDEQANALVEEPGTASLGFQVALEEFDKLASLLDFGINFRNIVEPDPYVRLKKRYEWSQPSGWVHRMSHDLFWERVDGAGLDSKWVSDRRWSDVYLFRSQTDGTWWHEDELYELTQRFLLYQQVNRHRLLTYQNWISWDTQTTGFHTTGYGMTLNWREKAFKDWLFFEVQPGVAFSEANNFSRADLTLMFLVEMRFFQP